MDDDDECGGHSGKQTGLSSSLTNTYVRATGKTHKYQRGIHIIVVFLHEFPIVFHGLLLVVFVESSAKLLLP